MAYYGLVWKNVFVRCRFDLVETAQFGMARGGLAQVIGAGAPRWRATYQTRPLRADHVRQWEVWWQRLRGGLNGFHAIPCLQRQPADYCGVDLASMTRAGGGAFTGIATLTALDTTTLSISGLPAGFVFRAGDFVGLREGGNRGLHRILADGAASGGGAVTVSVVPFVLTNVFTTSAEVVIKDPSCLMVPEQGSFSGEQMATASPVTFSGIQRVL